MSAYVMLRSHIKVYNRYKFHEKVCYYLVREYESHLNRACVKCLVKRGFVYNGLIVTGDMVKLGRKLLKAY